MKTFILIVFIFFSSVFSFADVKVTWGEGKLSIEDLSAQNIDENEFKLLQTQLLVDEELSNIVLNKDKKELVIPFDNSKEDLGILKDKIKFALIKSVTKSAASKPQNKTADNSNATVIEDDDSSYQIEMNKSLIVVGKDDEYFVEEDEVVENLVVLGGSVKIAGVVERLALIKGNVTILPTGKVTEKVTELAGTLDIDQGGFVTKDKTGLLDHFNISKIVIDQATDFSGVWLKLVLSMMRFIQVIFLLWIAFKLIPYFNRRLITFPYNWLQEGFMGLLHLCVMPMLLTFLAITLVGVTVIPLYLILFYLLGLLGYGVLLTVFGYKIVDRWGTGKDRSYFFYFLIGFLVVEALYLLPVFGYILMFIMFVLSVGLMTSVFFKHKKSLAS